MHLKYLDLQGFKSFPEKIKLEFNKGITTVVGPNGSGKSNISDSVRWVLGEQRAKSLRGEKMEDVIFAGTQNRKPLGFAEVSITIDNGDGKMPIDYTEVTVTRRVYRSGESDYLINGTQCRLKDIQELFMDTGVGREGYSIIGQGKIDEILSSKSEDRRRLFEEAAGIVKYKNRKNEAVSKLDKEQQNLLRVQDIINELELKVEPLAEQSEKAKVYLGYRDELKKYEINYFKLRVEKIDSELEKISENLKISTESLQDFQSQYDLNKEKIQSAKDEIENITQQVQELNNSLIEVRTEIEKNQGEINLSNEQIQNYSSTVKRLEEEIRLKKELIENKNNEINICYSKINALEIALSGEKSKLEKFEAEFDKLNETLSKSESHMEKYKSDMIEKIKKTTDIKGDISRAEAMSEQFKNRKEQLLSEKSYLSSQINDNKVHIDAQSYKNNQNEVLEKQLKSKTETLKNQKEEVKKIISELKEQYEKIVKSCNEQISKHKVLGEMEKTHEGFFRSVKELLKLRESGNTLFAGIHGAVGELIVVEKKYETAIEVALGSAVQNLVTSTEDDAKKAINYLKQNNMGRATFLPLTAVKGREFGNEKSKLISEKGVLGVAKDLIGYDKKYDGIVSSILGKVLIMDNIENAIQLSKKYGQSHRIVTLDGDVFNPGGAMTGGSVAKKSTNVFGRSREINELKISIENSQNEIQKVSSNISNYEKQVFDFETELTETENKITELHYQIIAGNDDVEKTSSVIKDLEEKLKLYVIEEKQIAEQQEGTQKNTLEAKNALAELDKEIALIDQQLSKFQNTLQSDKDVREEILSNITSAKINVSNTEQNKNSVLENIKRIRGEITTVNSEISDKQTEIENNRELSVKKSKEISEIKIKNDDMINLQRSKEETLNMLTDKRKSLSTDADILESQQQTAFETISQIKNDIFKTETKQEKFSEERQRIFDEIWESYEITYQTAKEYDESGISEGQLQSKIREFKNLIKDLGNVNVNSIEEYKETKERFEFLTKQKDDIIKAEESLIKIIQELSLLMEEQFKEQFAIISENFNIVFGEMFGGGKAYLKLSDESNVLESGIDIIAQPPGKNLQSMTLLSGGERALTAVAILFAILKMKPSPFCILDEIEAALDDANVKRFANYLKKFAGDNQFIVITHRKGTMEAADVMYGVTMQEQGVSKIVSVNFEDSKQLAQ